MGRPMKKKLTHKQKEIEESKSAPKGSNSRDKHIEPNNDVRNGDNPQASENNAIQTVVNSDNKKMGRATKRKLTHKQKEIEESKSASKGSNARDEHIEPDNDVPTEDNPQSSKNNAIQTALKSENKKMGQATKRKLTHIKNEIEESKSAPKGSNARDKHIEPDNDVSNEDNLQASENNAIQTVVNSENKNMGRPRRKKVTRKQKEIEESKPATKGSNAGDMHIVPDDIVRNEYDPQASKNNAIQTVLNSENQKMGRATKRKFTHIQKEIEESKSASKGSNARDEHIEPDHDVPTEDNPQASKNNAIQTVANSENKATKRKLTHRQNEIEESKSAPKGSNARDKHIEPDNDVRNEDNLQAFKNNAIQTVVNSENKNMGRPRRKKLTHKQKEIMEFKPATKGSNARDMHIVPDDDVRYEYNPQASKNNAVQTVLNSENQKMGRATKRKLIHKQKEIEESKFASKGSNGRNEHIEPDNDVPTEDNPQASKNNATQTVVNSENKKMGRATKRKLTPRQKKIEESKSAPKGSDARDEHIVPGNDVCSEGNLQASKNNAIQTVLNSENKKTGRATKKKKFTYKQKENEKSKSAPKGFNARDEHSEPDNNVCNEDNPQAIINNAIQTVVNSKNSGAQIEDNAQAFEGNLMQNEGNFEAAMGIERPNQDMDANPIVKRNTRGPTKEKRPPSDPMSRIKVEFNADCEPIGEGSVKLSSYLGPLVRKHVPVTLNNWRLLSNELKVVLRESIQARFKLDEEWQEVSIFQKMGCIWRASKCRLVRQIVKASSKEERLRLKPNNIKNMEEWKKFIELKTNPKFRTLSEKFKALRRNQLAKCMPHTCGRRGMARLTEDLREQSADPSSVSRLEVWVKSRTRKNGELVSMAVADTIEKIKKIENESQTSSTLYGEENTRSLVLGQDRFGWLKPMGRRKTLSKATSSHANYKQIARTQSRILELEETVHMLMKNQGEESWREESILQMGKESWREESIPQVSKYGKIHDRCDLLDWSGIDEIVAEGRVVSTDPNELVHKVPLGPNAMKVLIDFPRKSDAFLWRPTQSLSYIGEAEDRIVAWPASRVVLSMQQRFKKGDNSNTENKCKMYDWSGSGELVAEGRLYSSDPKQLVNDIPLGPSASVVWVDNPIQGDAFLWRPTAGMSCIGEAIGKKVAWPESKVVFEKFNAAASPAPAVKAAASPMSANFMLKKFNAAASPAPAVKAAASPMSANLMLNNKCKLIDLCGTGKIVAEGRVSSTDPNVLVHSVPLGKNAVKVWVDVAKVPNAVLWRPSSELEYIEDAIGTTIAWPVAYAIAE